MATVGSYLHMDDGDTPIVNVLPTDGVSIRIGDAVIFLTSTVQVDTLIDALAEAGSALMAKAEARGADETPGIDALHGPGAESALDRAVADGSIFGEV